MHNMSKMFHFSCVLNKSKHAKFDNLKKMSQCDLLEKILNLNTAYTI